MKIDREIRLVITLTPDGQFNCVGPLDNKLLCYGLLEMAKEAVSKHVPSKIVRPTVVVDAAFRG